MEVHRAKAIANWNRIVRLRMSWVCCIVLLLLEKIGIIKHC
jgi:hypothetical protein